MILDYYFYYFIIVTFMWVLCLCVSVYNVHAVPTESRRGRVVPSALTEQQHSGHQSPGFQT